MEIVSFGKFALSRAGFSGCGLWYFGLISTRYVGGLWF